MTDLNLHAVGGSGTGAIATMTPEGPIIGSLDAPWSAQIIPSNNFLSSDDIDTNDTGDFGDRSPSDCSWEMMFSFAFGGPYTNDYLLFGPQSSAAGGYRQYSILLNSSSAIETRIAHSNGNEYAAGGTIVPVAADSYWYQVIGVFDWSSSGGTAPVLYCYVNGVLSGSNGPLPAGDPRSIGSTALTLNFALKAPGASILVGPCALYRSALSATRVAAHWDAARNRGFPRQYISERLDAIGNVVGSIAPRSLQAGKNKVNSHYMIGQSAADEMRLAVEGDDVDAALFVTADGALTFLQDGHRSNSPYNTSQVTLGDAGGSEIPYANISAMTLTDSTIINDWSATGQAFGPTTPVTQQVTDATSIAANGRRAQVLSDVPINDDSAINTIVTELLAKYKDPIYTVREVDFDFTDPNVVDAVLGRELLDHVTVKRTPPGGGLRTSQDHYIQQIELAGGNDGVTWKAAWGLNVA